MKEKAFPHGGNLRALAAEAGRDPCDILDASASINPLGPPPWLRDVLSAGVADLVHYPDPDCTALLEAASARYGAPASHFVAGNGTSQLLFALPRCTGLARAVIPSPAYTDYAVACHKSGMDVRRLPGSEFDGFAPQLDRIEAVLRSPSMVVIASPANPTGVVTDAGAIVDLAGRHPQSLFLVDEAFADFVPGFASLAGEDRPHNVAVLLSLTKSFAVPGLRLGLLAASPDLADWVRRTLAPWSVGSLPQAVGLRALADTAFLEETRAALPGLRRRLAEGLTGLGLTVFPSQANFLLARLSLSGPNAPEVCRRLLTEHGVALRDCTNFSGLSDRYLRVAVRPEAETDRILDALAAVLAACPMPASRPRLKTPALMVQGTTSSAGKSVMAAGLCRLLSRAGYKVAPFKSQNMSLNSGVTADGLEMGRAQIVQARACRLAPDARMNPILLKPTSELGSQVIVLGKPVGTMRVTEYIAYKPTAFAAAREAYDTLAGQADVMVLEGAGSPAEVNLKAHDIVNMAMARHAGASVLLAADIDRGGAYAGLLGTMECLPETERALVAGYVLNRFRGDATLLAPANDYLAQRTGRDVLAVVPFLPDLGLPDEDSVTFKDGQSLPDTPPADPALLDIAVIDLPHLSNATDCDALAVEPDARLRRVREVGKLGRPDAVLLLGSKNTLADLAWLKDSGLAAALTTLAADGKTEIIGICAGLQMLGDAVADPLGLESDRRHAPGLGLLPLTTRLAAEKTLTAAEAVHTPTGLPLHGYEIHHGVTEIQGNAAALDVIAARPDGHPLGYARQDAPVWGAYLHGIFDADAFRRQFLNTLRQRRGQEPITRLTPYDIDPALDRLADVLEERLGLATVRRLLGL
ncbi:MAG: cobyric acid synthase CobQ/L-threonine-O-3-phosphate decarboxylase [Solidesulfovibrio magneticus str. Maddingley MBC34]|uniref:Cobyric acid synthase n=1 Tax=Solidesulfovibrio magneticus str. Maddingley MBC34 TaxID=1206767 RepID=K6GT86_9BACT|nr:MAG: cobyric acid synthase CobQ/L-threonine-O-3-phosphate decarboxylase [Solidesulfovibrio magneticus str. Maddingley MBC34]